MDNDRILPPTPQAATSLLRRVLEVFAPFYDRQPFGMHMDEQMLIGEIRELLLRPAPNQESP